MSTELKRIDISHVPELMSIAEEVRASKEPRVLGRDQEDIAVLMPIELIRRRRTKRASANTNYEAFASAAGGWKGIVDARKFKRDIAASRGSRRPPVSL